MFRRNISPPSTVSKIKAISKPAEAGDKLIYTALYSRRPKSSPPKDDFDILLSLQRTPNDESAVLSSSDAAACGQRVSAVKILHSVVAFKFSLLAV
jgi:hypothetical protein